ncbi:MAG: hypothetical protein H7330_04325 [Hymenobacteraceae bacterium]|nr:hypothetical protein [Hymenobacteraceae bacterium]
MFWHYLAVFFGAFLFDVVPFPFFPAFTIMLFLQVIFGLEVGAVLVVGVIGSVLGRYLLALYIPYVSDRYFNPVKNEDIRFLGEQMKPPGWKSQVAILAYSLLPLPTTPLFVAAGMARLKPVYIIPAFFVGKLTSDAAALSMGKYASQNVASIRAGLVSWQSLTGLAASLVLFGALLFIDWRTLVQQKKFSLRFSIFK